MKHSKASLGARHPIHNWEYADASARTGASGFVSDDVGKIAKQLDDNTLWQLTAITPVWKQVDGASGGSGEANTGSNVGAAGVGVFFQKSGVDLQFKKLNAGSAKVSISDDVPNTEVDIDVVTGTSADSVCVGNDSRLSDARTPTSHASSHQSGGGDSIKLDDLAAPDDNTDLDATTSAHGLLPKLGGGTTNFLRADGSWAAPSSGTDVNAIHKNVAAEISTITEKAAPFRDDLLVLEDSEDSNNKKRVKVGDLLASEPYYFTGPAVFFDEFYPPAFNNQWTTATSGTGSLVQLALEQGGQAEIRAGNANGRTAELLFGGGTSWQSLATSAKRISMRARYDGTNNGRIEFEVHYQDANNYAFLRGDWGGNWNLHTANGGTETVVDTGVAVDTAWHVFRLDVGSGEVGAYIDGVLKATSTTNIPAGAGTVSIYVQGLGTGGTKSLFVDGFHYLSERAT
jgi:hypothetical protein